MTRFEELVREAADAGMPVDVFIVYLKGFVHTVEIYDQITALPEDEAVVKLRVFHREITTALKAAVDKLRRGAKEKPMTEEEIKARKMHQILKEFKGPVN